MKDTTAFSQYIRAWRGRATQEQAAAAIGVPVSTLRAWEQARQEPKGYVRELVLRELRRQPSRPDNQPLTAGQPTSSL